MADEKDKKYYWLKLKRDFFKRHDIQIIEDLPNGKDYVLFYLKLLCESVDHEGNLRFSEEIPYNEQMLASLTHTNIDIVRSAVKLFGELRMIDIMDDGTYYMNKVEKMIGSETYWAQKKREQRERQLEESEIGQCPKMSLLSPKCPSKSIEKDKEKDKEIDNKKNNKKEIRHKYGEYENVLLSDSDFEKLKSEFPSDYTARIENLSSYIASTGKSYKNHLATIRNWARKENTGKENKPRYGSFDVNDAFKKALNRSYTEPEMHKSENSKTAADDENVKKRMEALKAELGQGADQ